MNRTTIFLCAFAGMLFPAGLVLAEDFEPPAASGKPDFKAFRPFKQVVLTGKPQTKTPPIPTMGILLENQLGIFIKGLYDGKVIETIGASGTQTSYPYQGGPVCNPVANKYNGCKEELDKNHKGQSCGKWADIGVTLELGKVKKVTIKFGGKGVDENTMKENTYKKGAYMQALYHFSTVVLKELEDGKISVSPECKAVKDDTMKNMMGAAQLQQQIDASAGPNLKSLTDASAGEIDKCEQTMEESEDTESGPVAQLRYKLCNARAAIESAYVYFMMCEVMARANKSYNALLTQPIMNDINAIANRIKDECRKECKSSPTPGRCAGRCATKSYQPKIREYFINKIKSSWPGQGSSGCTPWVPAGGILLVVPRSRKSRRILAFLRRAKALFFSLLAIAGIVFSSALLPGCHDGGGGTEEICEGNPTPCPKKGCGQKDFALCCNPDGTEKEGQTDIACLDTPPPTSPIASAGVMNGEAYGALQDAGAFASESSNARAGSKSSEEQKAATAGNLGTASIFNSKTKNNGSGISGADTGKKGSGSFGDSAGSHNAGGGLAQTKTTAADPDEKPPSLLEEQAATYGAGSGGAAGGGESGGNPFSFAGLMGQGSDKSGGGGAIGTDSFGQNGAKGSYLVPIDDPADYFSRMEPADSLFKKVERRYKNKEMSWLLEMQKPAAPETAPKKLK